MDSSPDSAALTTDGGLSDQQVAEFLRHNPDFLLAHPELLGVLTPPSRHQGDGVVDMQGFMIERLRGENERLAEHHDALLDAGRHALSKQSQVHEAVIAMLGARTLEHLIEVVTTDFLRTLHVDVVALCVEGGGEARRHCGVSGGASGVTCLERGAIDTVLGVGRDALFGADVAGDERIFGAGAGLVRSAALLRLRLGGRAPVALLALGSRRAERFASGQGGEPLGFLARALEHCLRAWLDLPA